MITVQEIVDSEENYNWWLTTMPDALLNLSILPKQVRVKLDYSVISLDTLEKYIIENYTMQDVKERKNKVALDLFTRYIGETFKRNLKDIIWSHQNDPKVIDYGYPILIKRNNLPFTPQNPTAFVVASIDRQMGNYISRILENNMEDES